MAVGSTSTSDQQYLFEDTSSQSDTSSATSSLEEKGEDTILDDIYGKAQSKKFDPDDVMASTVQGARHEGAKLAHLAKTWRIYDDIAKKTIGTTLKLLKTNTP